MWRIFFFKLKRKPKKNICWHPYIHPYMQQWKWRMANSLQSDLLKRLNNYKHCSDDTLSSGVLSIFAKTTVLQYDNEEEEKQKFPRDIEVIVSV